MIVHLRGRIFQRLAAFKLFWVVSEAWILLFFIKTILTAVAVFAWRDNVHEVLDTVGLILPVVLYEVVEVVVAKFA